MILSDKRILEEIEKGTIKIAPYDRACLGSNSYDVCIWASGFATYREHILDAKSTTRLNILKFRKMASSCTRIFLPGCNGRIHRNACACPVP